VGKQKEGVQAIADYQWEIADSLKTLFKYSILKAKKKVIFGMD